MTLTFLIPVKTKNASNVGRANSRFAAMAMARAEAAVRDASLIHTRAALARAKLSGIDLIPCRVTLERLSTSTLDDDGVTNACKRVRDSIAKALGVDDGGPFIRFEYENRKCKRGEFGVLVTIERVADTSKRLKPFPWEKRT